MATPAYMSITGTKQGLITTGQRAHKPVKITLFTPSQNPF